MKNRHLISVPAVAALIALCFSATLSAGPETTGQWNPAGSLLATDMPYSVHSHWLPSGKAMIWPGDETNSGDDPWSWDPAPAPNGSFTRLAKPGYNIFCSGHTFLADGTLFVAGGHNGTNTSQNLYGLKQVSIFDPSAGASGAWSSLPDMNNGRWYPTSTLLANGDVLVVSGTVDPSTTNIQPEVYEMSATPIKKRELTGAQLGQDLYPQMLLAPNGKVFNSGPTATTRYLDTTGTGSWSSVANRPSGAIRTYGSALMYAPGKVLSVGGDDPPTKSAEVINLNVSPLSWSAVGSMQFARRQLNAILLPDGKVLVTGGTSGSGFNNLSTPVFAAEMWDPANPGTWTTMASASIPRLYHSSTVLMADGRVLSMGGNEQPQMEIFSPPYLFKGARPTITSAPSTVNYGQSIFVQTPDALSINKVRILGISSTTHAFNQSQSITELSFTITAGGLNVTMPPSAVTSPPNPNVTPPGYYLLFILNGSGVPSVASIVQLTQQAQTVTAPAVTTTAASAVSATGAMLNGSAIPNGAATTAWFRYSITSPGTCNDSFGTRIPTGTGGSNLGSGTAAVAFPPQAVAGLVASTTYYFCAIASNSAGTGFGSVLSFVTPAASAGGSLSGSGTGVTTAANLTTEGIADWIHWGDASLNRKNVTAQLTTYAAIGGGAVNTYSGDPRSLSWTDGIPTGSSTNTNGVYIDGVGKGFSFTAPADTSTRTLKVYVGGWKSGGRLVAHLSDGSAADFTEDAAAVLTGSYDRNYTLSYKAAGAATLTVSWTMYTGTGNVTVNGAALQ